MEVIDRKFTIIAENPCKPGVILTEKDGVFFKALDEFFPGALREYIRLMRESGRVDSVQIQSAELLLERVMAKQATEGVKTPDIDSDCEAKRCLLGEGVE